jgi:hypothetical protein
MPERTAASVDGSLLPDIHGQGGRDIAIGAPVMADDDLRLRIIHRMCQGELNLRPHTIILFPMLRLYIAPDLPYLVAFCKLLCYSCRLPEKEGKPVPEDPNTKDPERMKYAQEVAAAAAILFRKMKVAIIPFITDDESTDAQLTDDKMVAITLAMASLLGGLWGFYENDDRYVTLFWDAATKQAREVRGDIERQLRADG